MDEIEKLLEEDAKADALFTTLKATDSMSNIADIVESMSEDMAKLVLYKFIYSRGS
jgi:hypothetical protein